MPHVDTPQSRCRFGIARADITPPVGIYHRMWGAAAHDRSTGVHRPLTATAMLFESLDKSVAGDRLQAVLALDHCLLWGNETDELRARLTAATGLAAEQILITFSHTHAAGLMDRGRASLPGGDLIAPYLETLAERVADCLNRARSNLAPATIVYGHGRCAMAAERDFWDEASGQFVCGFNPAGTCDDTVLVARVTNEQRQTVATLVHYACHPTTLAWQNTLISPDFPGAMREMVEQATSAPCVFLQGASGDVGPREGFVGDVAVADRNGRQLGYAALSALEALPPPQTRFAYAGPVVSGATIGTWAHQPLDDAAQADSRVWSVRRWTLDLPYRPDLPTLEATEQLRQQLVVDEQAARQTGDAAKASECRARIERCDRQRVRLSMLPAGKCFPLAITAWRMGGAAWVAMEGEMYNLLQRSLRERFPGTPLMLMTLANGWRPAYLPTRDAYGKGIYQESIAVLAAGSLETLTEAVGEQLAQWFA